jgi:hypothetical protein
MAQGKNANGNDPLGKLRHSVSMPKGSGVGYKVVYLAEKVRGERLLEECMQENRADLRAVLKHSTMKDELIGRLLKRNADLEQEVKRISGNGNGIPGIGLSPEAAAGQKQEEQQHEDEDDTHGA